MIQKVIWSTMAVFAEALLASDGTKAEGWPLPLAQVLFVASPILYDIDRNGKLDVLLTTESGEIVFVEQSGVPIYQSTLKIGPLPLARSVLAEARDQAGQDWWFAIKRRDHDKVPHRIRNRGKIKGLDQDDQLDDHFEQRRAKLPDESDLTAAGLKSLDLFMTSSLPISHVDRVLAQSDPLFSPTYAELNWDPELEFALPAHIIATPVICDLERDGHDELIVPVSYFFSAVQGVKGTPFGDDTAGTAVVAVAGLVVFDLTTKRIKWQIELSGTHKGDHHAYLYSSPVCADLTGDGTLEVVVADGTGNVHVIDAAGEPSAPWPVRMAPIAAQVVVEDLDADGRLEILVLDEVGNLVCFDAEAKELWLVQVFTGSDPPLDHAPTIGDINGDGSVDVVLGTAAGLLYAWDGASGTPIAGYPLDLPYGIRTEVALVKLDHKAPGLHLVFPAGASVYIVAGANPSCLDSIILGEESHAPIAVDDFTGDGKLDLIVTCSSGHVFCLSTEIEHHPLNTWSAPWSGGSKVSANFDYHGIFAKNRHVRDIVGGTLPVWFEIVDRRDFAKRKNKRVPYFDVTIDINGITAFRLNYTSAGSHIARVTVPSDRVSATVTLWMENEARQVFTDSFSVSFNIRFHRLLKFVLLAPFGALVLLVSLSANAHHSAAVSSLPTEMHQRRD